MARLRGSARVLCAASVCFAAAPCPWAFADPTLQRLEATCQEGEVSPSTHGTVEATAGTSGSVMVHVQRYVANCAWHEAFTLRTRGHSIELLPVPLPANAPVSHCICHHEIRYRIEGLAPGDYRLRVKLDGWNAPNAPRDRSLATGWAYMHITVR